MRPAHEPKLTKKEALDVIENALGFIPTSEEELLNVAAYGLVWRNARIARLEQQLLEAGEWPWKWERKRKRARRRGAKE